MACESYFASNLFCMIISMGDDRDSTSVSVLDARVGDFLFFCGGYKTCVCIARVEKENVLRGFALMDNASAVCMRWR